MKAPQAGRAGKPGREGKWEGAGARPVRRRKRDRLPSPRPPPLFGPSVAVRLARLCCGRGRAAQPDPHPRLPELPKTRPGGRCKFYDPTRPCYHIEITDILALNRYGKHPPPVSVSSLHSVSPRRTHAARETGAAEGGLNVPAPACASPRPPVDSFRPRRAACSSRPHPRHTSAAAARSVREGYRPERGGSRRPDAAARTQASPLPAASLTPAARRARTPSDAWRRKRSPLPLPRCPRPSGSPPSAPVRRPT
ncbi:serine/arginine repetitive matrix protein 1-like [Marmota flaviventris]|uniref:serine/arginine repetitive matrix protein 1-like n=1 Tax=Marmota flaviventris TaxID=93162 RepID=UPI003A8BFBE1